MYNGNPQPDPVPFWQDIGPSRISGTSKFTSSSGRFDDAPFGACGTESFLYSFNQRVSILVGGQYRYVVRSHHVDVASTSQGHGSINNNLDINGSR